LGTQHALSTVAGSVDAFGGASFRSAGTGKATIALVTRERESALDSSARRLS
jgi:hypothetical protein